MIGLHHAMRRGAEPGERATLRAPRCSTAPANQANRNTRPLGPWPIGVDSRSVAIPVVSRFAADRIAWTLVDLDDYGVAMSRLWHVETGGYAVVHDNDGRTRIALHTLILPPAAGLVVDHIEGNKLDNRRRSLRHLTRAQNSANQHRSRVGRSSRFHGVTFHRQLGKWQAQAEHASRCHYGGVFAREEDAAAARDRLAQKLWPGVLPLNFPFSEAPSMDRTITFQLEKTTKGALRFRELDAAGNPIAKTDDATVGVLYLRKSQVGTEVPQRLTVTISTQAA